VGGGTEDRTRRSIERRDVELVQGVAASFQTTDPAGLESDLMLHLLRLKRHPPRGLRNWEAHLSVALHNKALNWIRDHPSPTQDFTSLDAPLPGLRQQDDDAATLLDRIRAAERDLDFEIEIGDLLGRWDPWLSAVWKALLQTDGNLTNAAIRLRVHRNTIRAAVRRIVQFLKDHEFGDRR